LLASVLHFCSGNLLHILSGVDNTSPVMRILALLLLLGAMPALASWAAGKKTALRGHYFLVV